jgi:hypothetical protein
MPSSEPATRSFAAPSVFVAGAAKLLVAGSEEGMLPPERFVLALERVEPLAHPRQLGSVLPWQRLQFHVLEVLSPLTSRGACPRRGWRVLEQAPPVWC